MDEQSTAPKPFVFVLMPFAAEFDDVYEVGIKAACTSSGMHCERVDEQIFEGTILQRIYNQIAKADVVVADLTGRNVNVFYETGYAHALGKRVVLLTRNSEDIPFDVQHFPHIIYEGRIAALKEQLERRLLWFAQNPSGSRRPNEGLEFFIEKQPLQGLTICASHAHHHHFQIDIHNSAPTTATSVSLALIVEGDLKGVDVNSEEGGMNFLPDGRQLFRQPRLNPLFPDEWTSVWVSFSRELFPSNDYDVLVLRATLRAYYETGPQDFEFTLVFPAQPKAERPRFA